MKFKSKIGVFLLASTLLFGGALVGCGGDSGGSTPKPTFYVTVPTNDEYTIDGVVDNQGFKEGKMVEFSVTMTHPDDYILDSVYYDSEECDYDDEEEIYYFQMPAYNVEIRVNYHAIPKYSIEVEPEDIVVGRQSTGTLFYNGGAWPGEYTLIEEEGEGVTGDVEIDGNSITGVTAGTIKLNALISGAKVLSEPKTLTVRVPEKGESPETAYSASEAYQEMQSHRGETWKKADMYVAGVVSEIVENDKNFANVTFKIAGKNASASDVSVQFFRIGCAKDSELRDLLDIGSNVLVCSELSTNNTSYRIQYGTLESVENITPVGLMADLTSVLLAPGQTGNAGARIAPRGCSDSPLTYTMADTSIATVDEDGTIHGVADGSTKLTISAEDFDSIEVAVIVATTEHPGTQESPYTTDEAVFVTSQLGKDGKLADKYIKGVVSEVVSHHETGEDGKTFANSTFYLKGTAKDFYCFRVNTSDEIDEALVKGAEVLIHTTLYNYKGDTPENDKGDVLSIDVSKVHLIETLDSSIEVSLEGGTYDLSDFGRAYPEAIDEAIVYESNDDDVFTVSGTTLTPVTEGEATLIATCGDARVEIPVSVVQGPVTDKWATSFSPIVELADIEYPAYEEGKTVKADERIYVIAKVTQITYTDSGSGFIVSKDGQTTVEVYKMWSFDGTYSYQDLTFKPVKDSVVVLYGYPASYQKESTQKHELADCRVMQLDGEVCTTPEIVGITLTPNEKTVKVDQSISAFVVSSTRKDAPLDSQVAITWAITNGSEFASIDPSTGEISGIAEGDATVQATYGNTGLTASAIVHVVPAGEPVEHVVTIEAPDNWLQASAANEGSTQVCDGVEFRLSKGEISSDLVKVYKNQTLSIGGNNIKITKIVITCTAKGTSKYGPGCFGTVTPSGYTYNEYVGTWSGSTDDAVVFTATSEQVRISKFVITYIA